MMTSKEVAKCDAVENRRRSPLDHLPPPANSNKPLTPFSIEDILNKPSVKRSYTICGTAHLISSSEKHRPSSIPLSSRALLNQTSPLCALEELASKTFKGLEVSVLQAAEGKSTSPKIQLKNTFLEFNIMRFPAIFLIERPAPGRKYTFSYTLCFAPYNAIMHVFKCLCKRAFECIFFL